MESCENFSRFKLDARAQRSTKMYESLPRHVRAGGQTQDNSLVIPAFQKREFEGVVRELEAKYHSIHTPTLEVVHVTLF